MKKLKMIQGQVFSGAIKIGGFHKFYKFGYWPTVRAFFKDKEELFEIDDPDLLAKAMKFLRENIKLNQESIIC